MKIYTYYTPSHEVFFKNYFLPTAKVEFDVVSRCENMQFCKSAKFCSNGWRETQYNKVLFWIDAVKSNMGDLILCSDVDVQFLGSCKSILQKSAKNNDLIFQVNDPSGGICSGFFVCRCSHKTLSFFEIVARRLKRIMHEDGGGEQFVMSDIFREGWHGLKISKLDMDEFWSPRIKYKKVKSLKVPENILVHHANWTVGVQNKTLQLDHVNTIVLQNRSLFTPIKNTLNKKKDKNRIALCLSSLLRDFDVSSIAFIFRIIKALPSKPDLIGVFPHVSKTKKNLKILKSLEPHTNKQVIKFVKDPKLESSHLSMSNNMANQRSGIEGNLLQST